MQFDLDFSRAYPAIDAVGGFRTAPEDFFVDEQLGFELTGSGEHLCLHIEKRGQNTVWIAAQLAEAAGIKQMDVGYCGLKDRHAVTRQWFSLYLGQRELAWQRLSLEGCVVLEATRHDRKLRPGMHAGNAFVIRLRGVEGDCAALDQRWMAIAAGGVPNYFGEQRFGREANNLLRAQELLDTHARIWRERKNQFVVSAARAWLFNAVLADRVVTGEWNKTVVGDPQALPTGPLWGRGRSLASDTLLQREQQLLAPYAGFCEKLEHVGLQQERRSLPLQLQDAAARWEERDLVVGFALPPGTYATSVLRELLRLQNAQNHNP